MAHLLAKITEPSRRGFLGQISAFTVGLSLGGVARAAQAVAGLDDTHGAATPNLFIGIEADGTVRLTCHRQEMGQHVWTSITQLLVEELDVEWDSVRIEQAPGHPRYGDQNTDGSRSIRYNFERLRYAGAAMRTMLEQAAAQRWKVKPARCTASRGVVKHTDGRTLTYGELAADAAKRPVPKASAIKLRKREAWRAIGKPVPNVTTPAIVRGGGEFGQDVQVEGMRVAVIAHPPRVLDTVRAVDDAAALAIPGVEKVLRLPAPKPPLGFQPLGGVAVIAKDTWAAIKGREALRVEWAPGPNAGYTATEFEALLWKQVRQPGKVRLRRGDAAKALAQATTKVEAEYYVPHLAHASMEPPAVVARWQGGKVWCRGCIQTPQAARKTVAAVCGVPEDDVTIEVTWLGGGFGRKSKPDFFAEAAWLAREAGVPIKVVWTREDDLRHGYYHTVSAQRMEAALDAQGDCVALLHRTAFPPIGSTFSAGATEPSWGEMRLGATDTPFAVPHLQVESGEAPAHLRIGWLRSVANIYHAFAVQSFAAELAYAAGQDPKDYLLKLIGPPRKVDPNDDGAQYDNYGSSLKDYPIDTGRMAHTVRRAAEMAQWGRALPAGHGLGIAVHRSFTSYVATVVEVAVADGRLSIPGVWSVIDAGTVVNPSSVANQMEGGTLFGLSNALFGQITTRDGVVEQRNFPQWRVMRMNEAPRQMQVEIVPSTAPPGGVGEPPTPPAAPALANALFAATGVRIRRLPIFSDITGDRLPMGGAG